jgi:hypothetical protein
MAKEPYQHNTHHHMSITSVMDIGTPFKVQTTCNFNLRGFLYLKSAVYSAVYTSG